MTIKGKATSLDIAHLGGTANVDIARIVLSAVKARAGEEDLHSRATASKLRQPGRQLRLAARSSRSAERIFTTA